MDVIRRSLFALLLAALLVSSGCATTGDCPCESDGATAESAASQTSGSQVENSSGDKQREGPGPVPDLDGTLWMQSGAEYEASTRQAYTLARTRLDEALETPAWTASLEQKKSGSYQKKPPAVVVDVDETVLDNSAYQARLLKDGETFDPKTWNDWCREANAPAVPGALAFAEYAAEQDVTVFYVTNREHKVEEATRENLKKLGFPLAEERDVILTKHEKEGWGSDKTPRRKKIAQSHRILLLVGDNLGDFVGHTEVAPDKRSAKVETHGDRWGQSWIVLPNPVYGDWESGTFDYDWSLERRKRLRHKLDTLETHSE